MSRGLFSGELEKASDSSGLLFCSLSWTHGTGVVAGLAEGLLSLLLVAVSPVMEVTTEAVSSRGSAATAALDDAEEEEEESKPAPCLSDGEDEGEEADEEEEDDDEREEVEANTGAASSGSRQAVTSGSSLALVDAGLGMGLGVRVGVGTSNVTGSGVGEDFGSVETLSAGSSTPHSACSTTSP